MCISKFSWIGVHLFCNSKKKIFRGASRRAVGTGDAGKGWAITPIFWQDFKQNLLYQKALDYLLAPPLRFSNNPTSLCHI